MLKILRKSKENEQKALLDFAYASKNSRKSKEKSKGKNLKLTNFTNRGLKKSPYTGRFRGSKKERG